MERRLYVIIALIITGFVSCQKDQGEIPSYIYIPDIRLTTTSAQGSTSDDIIDAWVYVDDNPIGCFPLPARVPILAEGNRKISVYGGIKADGISTRRRRYIFYQPFVTNSFTLRRGMVDTLKGAFEPVVSYYPSNQITIWYEDFTDPFVPFFQDAISDTTINRITDPGEVFEGAGCGLLTLSATQNFVQVATSENFDLPKGGIPVYLELNYKANQAFAVGLRSIYPSNILNQENTIIRDTYDDNGVLVWKKIYCEFTELVSSNINAISHEIFFRVYKDQGVSVPLVYIDNVRLIYGN
ncbi:MAG: hypothetical protein ACK40M_08405 [Flavobacteriales bacterium]